MALMQGAAARVAMMKPASMGGAFAGKSLGLGLGVGVWGPIALGVIGAAAVYSYMYSRRAEKDLSDEELELAQAVEQA